MKAKVTIQDIADALEISRNTVSKALNNGEGIAAATRDRILAKAAEMGYRQFSFMQTLSATGLQPPTVEPLPGSSGEIALLTTTQFSDSHFAVTMIDRLRRELAQFGYSLMSYYVSRENITQKQLPYPLPKGNTKAFICFEMFEWDYCDMLCAIDYPMLFVDGPSRHNGRRLQADQLIMENIGELTRLIGGLIRQGVQKFGFIGDFDHCQSFFERCIAVRNSLAITGQPFISDFIIKENHPINICHAVSSLRELPDCFVCASDEIAISLIRILNKLGKSVPEDVLVCGFDDSVDSRTVTPPLTTVHIHTQIMAFSAAQLLISRIKNPDLDFRTVYTQTDLVLRDSTRIGKEDAAQ